MLGSQGAEKDPQDEDFLIHLVSNQWCSLNTKHVWLPGSPQPAVQVLRRQNGSRDLFNMVGIANFQRALPSMLQ